MDCSMPGFSVLHHLLELAQSHIHWIHDAIQLWLSLSSPSLLALCLSLHQGLFQWVDSSNQVNKVLELQLQHQSFQWIFKIDFLYYWLVGSPSCPRDSQESSPASQFEGINSSTLSFLCSPTLTSVHDYWKNHTLTKWTFVGNVMSLLFNTLFRFLIAFLPRSKCVLISWLQSLSTVILEDKKIESVTVPLFPHLFAMKWWEQMPQS